MNEVLAGILKIKDERLLISMNDEIHIGKEIEKRFHESGLKLAEFANRLNTGKRNVYSIFERHEITTNQLRKISDILNFDFFSLYVKKETLAAQAAADFVQMNSKISLVVELDGTQSTVERWIQRLMDINVLLNAANNSAKRVK